jgi:hypothetical protein
VSSAESGSPAVVFSSVATCAGYSASAARYGCRNNELPARRYPRSPVSRSSTDCSSWFAVVIALVDCPRSRSAVRRLRAAIPITTNPAMTSRATNHEGDDELGGQAAFHRLPTRTPPRIEAPPSHGWRLGLFQQVGKLVACREKEVLGDFARI